MAVVGSANLERGAPGAEATIDMLEADKGDFLSFAIVAAKKRDDSLTHEQLRKCLLERADLDRSPGPAPGARPQASSAYDHSCALAFEPRKRGFSPGAERV